MTYEFHQGPARALFNKYNNPWLDLSLAHSIHDGLLESKRVPKNSLILWQPRTHFTRIRKKIRRRF
jgi:hypothetical protein